METAVSRLCPEFDIYSGLLPLEGASLLELGCGKAQHTREIAEKTGVASILAMEVDEIQHAENLKITDLPKVSFEKGGAQVIDRPDNSFDIVMMFKSLHHVPVDSMGAALKEIHRVLKPGGVAYISEPVFSGDFNEILRLFHNEQAVRQAAFNACRDAVESGLFELKGQHFFNTPMVFEGFEEFEKNILGVTHTNFDLDEILFQEVKRRFMEHVVEGVANFQMPIRVDLLRKL